VGDFDSQGRRRGLDPYCFYGASCCSVKLYTRIFTTWCFSKRQSTPPESQAMGRCHHISQEYIFLDKVNRPAQAAYDLFKQAGRRSERRTQLKKFTLDGNCDQSLNLKPVHKAGEVEFTKTDEDGGRFE
jgi:hypothetical protein